VLAREHPSRHLGASALGRHVSVCQGILSTWFVKVEMRSSIVFRAALLLGMIMVCTKPAPLRCDVVLVHTRARQEHQVAVSMRGLYSRCLQPCMRRCVAKGRRACMHVIHTCICIYTSLLTAVFLFDGSVSRQPAVAFPRIVCAVTTTASRA
jgi:hypothetical protein